MSQEPRSEERSEGANTLVHCHRCGQSVTIPSATVATWTADHARQGHCEPLPRSWSLPPEPGPEVTKIRDKDGSVWEREDISRQWLWVSDDGSEAMVKPYEDWADFLEGYGPLVDATQDTTP